MHVIAAKAVAFGECLTDGFNEYTKQVMRNAKALAEALVGMGYDIVSGGTDNHLMLVDLRNKNVNGKQAEIALDASGITCNKNAVPYDTQPPLVTSGIRLGTAAMTTRGMKEPEMRQIAEFINRVITQHDNADVHKQVKGDVKEFCRQYPLYADFDNTFQDVKDKVEDAVKNVVGSVGSLLSKVGEEMQKAINKN